MSGTILVGHNIAFDIAHLRWALNRAAIAWTPPPSLDTLLLTATLEPSAPGFHLEAVAERFGVPVRGRHTALGDSLVTAEIFARIIPQLTKRNLNTLGDAIAFGLRAKAFVKRQRQSGWFDAPID
jgi:DNA polymerase-3 subunit epsilon